MLPKPYYEDSAITIYHADCRDVLPLLGPVDHIVTDPPYSEQTHAGARTARNYAFTSGDTDRPLITFAPLDFEGICEGLSLPDVRRWLVSFMDWRHIARIAEAPLPGYCFVRFGVWNKTNAAPQFTGDRPAQGWEGIAIMHREGEKMRWNGGGSRAVWTSAKEPNNEHETQKPIPLMRELVMLFTDEGETILDPFAGSGTTLRAAKDLGRKAIGIEIELKYCRIAAERMQQAVLPLGESQQIKQRQAVSQPSMFGGMTPIADCNEIAPKMRQLRAGEESDRQ